VNRRLVVAVLALLACSASGGADPRVGKPVTHTIVIEGMQFKPATLTIRPGDSVMWINKDIVDHTATTPASAKQPFDSRMIKAGKSWKRTFTAAGKYSYLCTYHPTMTGVIDVAAARPAERRLRNHEGVSVRRTGRHPRVSDPP
jgi:plastocyanin